MVTSATARPDGGRNCCFQREETEKYSPPPFMPFLSRYVLSVILLILSFPGLLPLPQLGIVSILPATPLREFPWSVCIFFFPLCSISCLLPFFFLSDFQHIPCLWQSPQFVELPTPFLSIVAAPGCFQSRFLSFLFPLSVYRDVVPERVLGVQFRDRRAEIFN